MDFTHQVFVSFHRDFTELSPISAEKVRQRPVYWCRLCNYVILTLPLLDLLLLHVAGELVHDNYYTLEAKDAKYVDTMQKLSEYFSPKKHVQFQMLIFRENMQEQEENLDSVHRRLG